MILPETKTLAHLFEDCTSKYPDLTVNTMVGWTSGQTYQELKEKAGRLSILLDSYGVGSGDKVAILSAGHPNWIAAFFSATAFGRVAVPLLPDFSPSVVANVLAHSEAKALFVSAKCYEKLSAETLAALSLVIDIDTLEPIAGNKMVEGANSSVTGASTATVEAAGTSAKAEAAASGSRIGSRPGEHYRKRRRSGRPCRSDIYFRHNGKRQGRYAHASQFHGDITYLLYRIRHRTGGQHAFSPASCPRL